MEDINDFNDTPILFGPVSGKSLIRAYPELAEEKEFKAITNDELLFVWYVSNRSSPIDPDLPDAIRFKMAASYVFKGNESVKREFGNMNIPDAVKSAMERMRRYSPDARLVGKRIIQSAFKNYQKLVNINVDTDFLIKDKDGVVIGTDWTGRKQYIDSTAKMSEILPSLIKQLEEGFGIEDIKKEDSKSKAIDRFHQLKKERS